jgi:hypothetical protein
MEDFERFVSARGMQAANLDPPTAVDLLIEFFVAVRADDVEFEGVYVNWGTYDWHDGNGSSFQYSVWRQFVVAGSGDDEGIWELEFRFHFRPDPETEGLGSGGEMCLSPGSAEAFRETVAELPASGYAARSLPQRVAFSFLPGG